MTGEMTLERRESFDAATRASAWLSALAAFGYVFTSGFHSVLVTLALAAACVLSVLLVIRDLRFTPRALLMAPILCYAFFGGGLLTSGNYTTVAEYLCFTLLVVLWSNSDTSLSACMKCLVAFGLFHALSTIWLKFDASTYLTRVAPMFASTYSRLVGWYRDGCVAGLAPHYSTNGIYMMNLTIALTSLLIFRRDWSSRARFLLVVCDALALIALLLTGKRAHLLFTVASLLLGYYVYLGRTQASRRFMKLFFVFLLALIGLYVAYLLFPDLLVTFKRFFGNDEEGDLLTGRGRLYGYALQLFAENPIFGVGWSRYGSLYAQNLSNGYFAHVHNVYLQLLCETGIVGFTLVVSAMALSFVSAWRTFKRVCGNAFARPSDELYAGFSLVYQAAILMYSITGNPIYNFQTLFPYALSIACCAYVSRKRLPEIVEAEEAAGL